MHFSFKPIIYALSVLALAAATGCDSNPQAPSDTDNPDGLLWANSGWQGITAVDLANDTVITVSNRPGSAYGIAAGEGAAYVGYADGMIIKFSSATLQQVDSVAASSGDSGRIEHLLVTGSTLWATDQKEGRPSKVIKLTTTPLAVVAANPAVADTSTIIGIGVSGAEVWLLHAKPPVLARIDPSGVTPIDPIALGQQSEVNVTELGIGGRTAWILANGNQVMAVNLDTRAITGTIDLTTLGPALTMAVSSPSFFVGTKTSPCTVHSLTTASIWTHQIVSTRRFEYDAQLTFLRAKGSRLIAMVAKGYYHQYEEIDIATMQLKRELGETYCYGLAIE